MTEQPKVWLVWNTRQVKSFDSVNEALAYVQVKYQEEGKDLRKWKLRTVEGKLRTVRGKIS